MPKFLMKSKQYQRPTPTTPSMNMSKFDTSREKKTSCELPLASQGCVWWRPRRLPPWRRPPLWCWWVVLLGQQPSQARKADTHVWPCNIDILASAASYVCLIGLIICLFDLIDRLVDCLVCNCMNACMNESVSEQWNVCEQRKIE